MDSRLQSITQIYQDGKYDQLARRFDQLELEEPELFESPQWPSALHLLAHLYALSLEPARFLYKRFPESVRSGDANVNAAFAVLQKLWVMDYETLWSTLAAPWDDNLQPLVAALRNKLQQTVLALISHSYTEISCGKVAALLGLPEGDAAQTVTSLGWNIDEESRVIQPVAIAEPVATMGGGDMAGLESLGDYVLHLDF